MLVRTMNTVLSVGAKLNALLKMLLLIESTGRKRDSTLVPVEVGDKQEDAAVFPLTGNLPPNQ